MLERVVIGLLVVAGLQFRSVEAFVFASPFILFLLVAQAVWGSRFGPLNDPESFGVLVKLVSAVLRNRTVTDPVAGTLTVYDDDDTTPLLAADLWQDAAGTVPYSGSGAERRDRLT
jgi:hypothetical protein